MTGQRVTIAIKGGVADVRLSRADRMNAMDRGLIGDHGQPAGIAIDKIKPRPSRAKTRAMAAPSPEAAPVTNARLPAS